MPILFGWADWIVDDLLLLSFCERQLTQIYIRPTPVSVQTLLAGMNPLMVKVDAILRQLVLMCLPLFLTVGVLCQRTTWQCLHCHRVSSE